MKKWYQKFVCYLIDKNNERMNVRADNRKFLVELCTINHTLDLDKYLRLEKMIKNKYKK